MRAKRVTIAALILLAVAGAAGCDRLKRAKAERPQISRCVEELNSIPEVAALLRSRSREGGQAKAASRNLERPFEGMRIALVLSGMIKSRANAEANYDDWCYAEDSLENFQKLVSALKQNGLPPTVDFISGKSMDPVVVEQWLASGNLIGTTSYSRLKVRRKNATAQKFIEDVARNHAALAPFWERHPHKQKYFRFPRQKTSRDSQKREQINAFLKEKGYVEVLATINAQDGLFTETYCAALEKDEKPCAALVKEHFKTLLLDTTLKAREVAQEVSGSDIKHILVIGVNRLTCDNLSEVLAWYKSLGAQFISLEEALSDPFYAQMDQRGRPLARTVSRETTRRQLEAGRQ